MYKNKEMVNYLIESLPYILKFRNKLFVFKYGGSIIESKENKMALVEDISLLLNLGVKVIIVHGGGKLISKRLEDKGIETVFKDGYRVTNKNAIKEVEMVLSGHLNNDITLLFNNSNVQAVGLNGKDAGLIYAEKKVVDGNEDIGYVGDVKSINTDFLNLLMDSGYLPIISPIGYDKKGHTYNINADDVACEVAKEMKAEKLFFISDVNGIYFDVKDENTFISRLSLNEAKKIINTKSINGGMIPKVKSCIEAVEKGVNSVHVINGNITHSILLEVFTNEGIGTMIEKGDDISENHENV